MSVFNISRGRAIRAGLCAGIFAALVMTVVMLLLAWLFGIATPLTIIGDRLSVFIPADTFLSLMGRVGGYNRPRDRWRRQSAGVGGESAVQIRPDRISQNLGPHHGLTSYN